MIGLFVAGSSVLKFDGSTRKVKLRPATSVGDPVTGMVVDGDFHGSMGTGSVFKFYGSSVGIAVDGIEALLNPAVLEVLHQKRRVEAKDVADEFTAGPPAEDLRADDADDADEGLLARLRDLIGGDDESDDHTPADDGRADRATGDRREEFTVGDADPDDPEDALPDGGTDTVVGGPAGPVRTPGGEPVADALNQRPDQEDPLVGEPEDGKGPDDYDREFVDRVPIRGRFLINPEVIRDFAPFNMMDGSGFQTTLHYARQSMAEYGDEGGLVERYVWPLLLLILGWWFGKQGAGGGGGGGGGAVPIPMPMIDVAGVAARSADLAAGLAPSALDVAGVVV
jgi:hypothetical protein